MEFSIVPMKEQHISAVADLELQCFSQPWSAEQLREELTNDCAFFFVAVEEAEREQSTAGYIGCHVILDEGYITNVAVSEEHRRQGIGQTLVSHIVAVARQKRLSFVTLEVRAGNQAASKLYQNNGFQPVGVRKNYYTVPAEDAVLMTLQLKKDEQNNNEDFSD